MPEPTGPFDLSPREAVLRQKELRKKIQIKPLEHPVRTAAGADISFNRGSNIIHASIVVLRLPDLTEVARSLVTTTIDFPYIPGLLAYREIPALLKAWEQLKIRPDVVIMDGHGVAHPRRMGIATHFGIVTDQPAIGCAKKILTGSYNEPGAGKGSYSFITNRNEKIGIALRSRSNTKPVFISPGHRVSFDDAYALVMQCLTRYKLPETTRAAHLLANKLRKGEVEAGYREQ